MKIYISQPNLKGNELEYLKSCIETNWISSKGDFITKFEQQFAEFCNVSYASSCSSGTAALHLALLALGIGKGDEVIIPNITFVATANVVRYCNATPVLVDVDKETWNIDPDKIKEKITSRTKAIIPVHLYGNPCDMNKIMDIAKEYSLFVIEDAAEAHGAKYKGKMVGSIGDVGCFSLYGNKIITTGEGGMCVSNNEKIIDRINFLKNHAMSKLKKYWHEEIGYNYRLTNIQAAIGLAQLERIDKFIEKRKKIFEIYKKNLENVDGVEFQKQTKDSKMAFWMVSILVENRDELMEKLQQKGVETRPVFYPLNEMKPYSSNALFQNSEFISYNGISLPTHVNLTEEEVSFICDSIKKILQ